MTYSYVKNPPGYEIDLDGLKAFENGLDPHQPEQSTIPARVLGYGEISTVFAIQTDALKNLALKRLPIFYSQDELATYIDTYVEYNRVLEEDAGLRLPAHGYAAFPDDSGRPVFYIIQEQCPAESIGHKVIHHLNQQGVETLVTRLLNEARKIWDFNAQQDKLQIALDGQLSNWVITGFTPAGADLGQSTDFLYLDTSTPLMRIAGEEQLNPELFLRSAPSFMRWILRLFFLDDVLNRYYDFHLVTVDIIAQFHKEQRPELIPGVIEAANRFFAGEGTDLNIAPFTEKEINAYYKEDALIWSLYLSMRRFDRFLHRRILNKHYPYILPGKIKR